MKMGYGSKSWSTPWLGEVWFVAAATGASVWGDSTLRFSSVSGFVWKHDKYGIFKQTHHHPSSFSHYIKIAVLVAISQFFWQTQIFPDSFRHEDLKKNGWFHNWCSDVRLQMWWLSGWGASLPFFHPKMWKKVSKMAHWPLWILRYCWFGLKSSVLLSIFQWFPAEMVDSSEMPRSKSEVSRLLAFRWELGAKKKRQSFQFGRHGNMDENGDTHTHIIYEYIESHVHTYNRNVFFLKEPLDSLSSRRGQVALSKVARNFSLLRSETWQTGSNSLSDIHMP